MNRPAPILTVDLSRPQPVYLQIADQIRAALVAGELRPGDRLPSVRQLASDLHVHHNTVALAYRLLAQEGWLELRRGRGARVRGRTGAQRPEAATRGKVRQELESVLARAAAAGFKAEEVFQEVANVARRLWKTEGP